MKFPNKMITETFNQATGKTFTWSPSNYVFTDESGKSDYPYYAMLWLKDNGWLVQLPWDHKSIAYKFQLKKLLTS